MFCVDTRTYPEENDAVIEAEPEETLNSTPTPVEAAEAEHQKVNVVVRRPQTCQQASVSKQAIGTAEIFCQQAGNWYCRNLLSASRQLVLQKSSVSKQAIGTAEIFCQQAGNWYCRNLLSASRQLVMQKSSVSKQAIGTA